MGLKIATQLLESSMNSIFKDLAFDGVSVYYDDILVSSFESRKEQMILLHDVLPRLERVNAQIELAKLEGCKEEMTFFGLKLNEEGS